VSSPRILKVAVDVPLSREFDYLPATDDSAAPPGSRVLVPFGRRREVGLVLDHSSESTLATSKIRRCISTIDDEPLLSEDDLWLIRFSSDYYHHPIGEVVAAALPAMLRQGKALHQTQTFVAVTDAGESANIETLSKRAPRQAELLELVRDGGGNGLDIDYLTEQIPSWRRAAKPLFEKGLMCRFDAAMEEAEGAAPNPSHPGPEPNEHQRCALDTIRKQEGFGAFVLDGVTGSGKTEVYLRLMQDVLNNGKQVLVLVPEIGLTPQLVSRLSSRLGVAPT